MSDTLQAETTARDFDFLLGRWHVANRRLRRRLAGSDDWEEFAATAVAQPILDGFGNQDVFRGRPILVRFVWSGVTTPAPRWEQAFSDDGGRTWETNWVMDFTPAEGGGE